MAKGPGTAGKCPRNGKCDGVVRVAPAEVLQFCVGCLRASLEELLTRHGQSSH